jgi:hypothetical protein
VPGRQSHALWSALGADSSGVHITHSAFSPPLDASALPQGLQPLGVATCFPKKLPIKLARSVLAIPCPAAQFAALLLATRPNSSTASSCSGRLPEVLDMLPVVRGERCSRLDEHNATVLRFWAGRGRIYVNFIYGCRASTLARKSHDIIIQATYHIRTYLSGGLSSPAASCHAGIFGLRQAVTSVSDGQLKLNSFVVDELRENERYSSLAARLMYCQLPEV